jgi:hypothetical protein
MEKAAFTNEYTLEPQNQRPFRISERCARRFVLSLAEIDNWLDAYEYALEEYVHQGERRHGKMTDVERQAHDEGFFRWLDEEFD